MPEYLPNLDIAVEGQNSAVNVTGGDVIGNKTDTIAGDSAMALLRRLLYGARVTCVPTGAVGVTLAGGAVAYAEPANYTEVVAACAVDSAIVGIALDTPSDAAILGEVDLGTGAGDPAAPIVTIPFEIASAASVIPPIYLPAAIRMATGTRIAGRLRTAAGAETINVKVLLKAIGD